MEKKREFLLAAISLVILALIIVSVMVIIFLLLQGLEKIGIDLGYFSIYIMDIVQGVSIGISLGFGYVIAKRLFDVIYSK